MRRWLALGLLGCAALSAQQAPIPSNTEISGDPYVIKNKWVIGGDGNWDYLTLDPVARRLFIAHQSTVQVVDIETGTLAGEIGPFSDAHAVVLDPNGQFGYVSDGRDNIVRVFDRRTFQLTEEYELESSPRALAFEPQTGWLFAFGSVPQGGSPPLPGAPQSTIEPNPCPSSGAPTYPRQPGTQSRITIIDPEKQITVANIKVCGVLGGAQADGNGAVYFTIENRNEIGRLDASVIEEFTRRQVASEARQLKESDTEDYKAPVLDFRTSILTGNAPFSKAGLSPPVQIYRLWPECQSANAVAVDGPHNRIFAACGNQKLLVVNSSNGAAVTSLITGPGTDAIAYDESRGLIFTANGGGYGSITVARRHVTDSYSVIQNLPTLSRARTMAIDPSTGFVYVVTDLRGADLRNPPRNGIGTLRLGAVADSFQVLVIGN